MGKREREKRGSFILIDSRLTLFGNCRQYQSMHAACEELRMLQGPGEKEAGRLYRIAMEKKGVFRQGSVPIEYARAQTDTPGREPWNHGWTR
jgi:large subunit ribosomal protein L40